ncbi:ShTK domain protein [Trichostrongylus colubriformis]|uniref:ShTK domain protein n=1 Tax=Trichostrongylus colubriformis TaxID=6319 RepID=A0AAN8FHT0_TRICO
MLFYVLIAFLALNAFTQEGVMAQGCQNLMQGPLCDTNYKKYCNDDIMGPQVRKLCSETCGCRA